MSRGIAICIGLNRLDEAVYGSPCPLAGCRNDAIDMARVAVSSGFSQVYLLLDDHATSVNFEWLIEVAKAELRSNQELLITYSGHGDQDRDTGGDEPDKKDEYLCFFDGLYSDDRVRAQLAKIPTSIPVRWITDSCHSASQVRLLSLGRPRLLPVAAHKRAIKAVTKTKRRRVDTSIRPNTITLSACQDGETASDGDKNGAFTGALLKALPSATDWPSLLAKITSLTKRYGQTPVLRGENLSGVPFAQ